MPAVSGSSHPGLPRRVTSLSLPVQISPSQIPVSDSQYNSCRCRQRGERWLCIVRNWSQARTSSTEFLNSSAANCASGCLRCWRVSKINPTLRHNVRLVVMRFTAFPVFGEQLLTCAISLMQAKVPDCLSRCLSDAITQHFDLAESLFERYLNLQVISSIADTTVKQAASSDGMTVSEAQALAKRRRVELVVPASYSKWLCAFSNLRERSACWSCALYAYTVAACSDSSLKVAADLTSVRLLKCCTSNPPGTTQAVSVLNGLRSAMALILELPHEQAEELTWLLYNGE